MKYISFVLFLLIFSCSSASSLTPSERKEISTHKIIDYQISNSKIVEENKGDFDIIKYDGAENLWVTCWYYPKSNLLRATIRRDPRASFSFEKDDITITSSQFGDLILFKTSNSYGRTYSYKTRIDPFEYKKLIGDMIIVTVNDKSFLFVGTEK